MKKNIMNDMMMRRGCATKIQFQRRILTCRSVEGFRAKRCWHGCQDTTI